MRYLPHTEADRAGMLRKIGVGSVDDLFVDIPAGKRITGLLDLPRTKSEIEVERHLGRMAARNVAAGTVPFFVGAGAYRHHVPASVDHLIQRSEFLTSYTPYQPEVAQGTLQYLFEFQTQVANLTGMEVANASHYDGATSAAEAVIMALGTARGKRRKTVVSPYLHPEYRQTICTYTQGMGVEVVGDKNGVVGLDGLKALIDEQTACVIVQNPDFLGRLESPAILMALAEAAHAAGALFVVSVNPISLGLLVPPGEYGADIVIGEGQPLGNGLNFGGPYLGFFACREQYVRKMAGRLVGETVDVHGRRGYVLTLSTREQHIRREKATSNICTNEGLCAQAAGVYMVALGKCGLIQVAELCYHKAHYAAERIGKIRGFSVVGDKPFFNEFIVKCPMNLVDLNRRLLQKGIVGGYDLGNDYPEMAGHMLFCVTEMNSRADIDHLVDTMAEVAS